MQLSQILIPEGNSKLEQANTWSLMKLLKTWLHMNTMILTKVVKLPTVHWW
jgi:hypothetical protein